ncbi:MEDS domain-containing protein [Halomarina pelagica]|uniref:MEDS domain-containing protein n=1 Tax=Halomarina pelagica TaxID=2961599 RepID=UPI0020C25D8F|nr:MEDS domain-containing protein [Halomarina sp. BND7]
MDHDRLTGRDAVSGTSSPPRDPGETVAGPTVRGPERESETPDLHHHVALLYATQDQQFAAVVPLIRDGLERGERCLYICDDNPREDVERAMRAAGIDVDAAVEAGDLSFHSKEGTFLRNGAFEPEEVIAFADEMTRTATEEGSYDAIRIAGEMTWALDGEHSVDRLIEYEETLNGVFPELDCVGICQYNVDRFSPEIINQIVRSHPNLVYDGTVGRDFYYIPSEYVFSPN